MYYSDKVKCMIEDEYQQRLAKHRELMSLADGQISALEEEDLNCSVKFIFTHLPLSDLSEETMFATVLDYARTALRAGTEMPWGRDIPVDIFLSDVLFPRVNNEWLEPARRLFYDLLAPRVKDRTMKDAIIETNYFCFEQATYVGSDMRTVPPTTLLKSAQGRCGEESVFAIMALRSIGIPARQIYVPRWAHCDDNHAWVEVWCDGEWHYLGACEPEEELDRGWFTSASSRAMLVESKAFYQPKEAGANDREPEESLSCGIQHLINRTGHYAPANKLKISVKDRDGIPVKGIRMILGIINAAKIDPIADLTADDRGCAEITIGKGSVYLHVTDGSGFMGVWLNTAENSCLELVFVPERFCDRVSDFDTLAPVITGKTNPPLDEETRKRQQLNTETALKIRKGKEAGFYGGSDYLPDGKTDEAISCPVDQISPEILREMLVKARGNYPELAGFLKDNPNRYAAKLLTTLNDKDYSDCNKDILTAHLKHAVAYAGNWDEEIFVQAVLAPRIYYEHMTDYRSVLAKAFSDEQKAAFAADPQRLWDYLEANVAYLAEEETANILATPAAVIKSGYGSLMSKKILFVAVLRTLGVPARITKETLNIEYYNGTEFVQVIREEIKDSLLRLVFADGSSWAYGFNWSVSVLKGQVFEPLNFRDEVLTDNCMSARLPHGCYRIITSNRLPNGNTYSRQYDTVLEAGTEKEVKIDLRPTSEKDMISRAKINDFAIEAPDGSRISISGRMSEGRNVLVWLMEDHEPSQHILNEMIASHTRFGGAAKLIFILGHREAAANALIARAAVLLDADIVVDPEFVNAEPSARLTFVDPDKLPLAIVTDEQFNTFYAVSGYNVGTAEMMIKILAMMS